MKPQPNFGNLGITFYFRNHQQHIISSRKRYDSPFRTTRRAPCSAEVRSVNTAVQIRGKMKNRLLKDFTHTGKWYYLNATLTAPWTVLCHHLLMFGDERILFLVQFVGVHSLLACKLLY